MADTAIPPADSTLRTVASGREHQATNGLLLRSDVHTFFDRGCVTVTPEYTFRVSSRLRRDWQNGRVYYQLDGQRIHLPERSLFWTDPELLEWHSERVFHS